MCVRAEVPPNRQASPQPPTPARLPVAPGVVTRWVTWWAGVFHASNTHDLHRGAGSRSLALPSPIPPPQHPPPRSIPRHGGSSAPTVAHPTETGCGEPRGSHPRCLCQPPISMATMQM